MNHKSVDLHVMEHFPTIQGEGHHTGRAAYFLRLGGCDVGCHWCDVKDSWDADKWPLTSINEMVTHVNKSGLKFCVITGGEPLMYNLDEITQALKESGIETAVETSGAHPISGEWDWICFSPKKFKEARPEWYSVANELKVIINHKSDFKFAEEHKVRLHKNAKLYLQPEWDKRDLMMPLIVKYVQKHSEWKISLQTHKYLGIS